MKFGKAHFDSIVIAIFFIGVSGLLGWFLIAKPVGRYLLVGQWDRVPATITSVQLLENVDPSNGATTYECQASYRYQVGGKSYEATDVSLYTGSDNLSNFHQRIFQELSHLEKSGEPFQAYVNPADPAKRSFTEIFVGE